MSERDSQIQSTRRQILTVLAATGIGSITWQRAVAQQAANSGTVTDEMLRAAEWVADLQLSDEEREATREGVMRQLKKMHRLREVEVPHDVPPAVQFRTLGHASGKTEPPVRRSQPREWASGRRPTNEEDLAFLPVTELASLLRERQVSSLELTELYLARLKAYDPVLKCVVTYTETLALRRHVARIVNWTPGTIVAPCTGSPGEPRI